MAELLLVNPKARKRTSTKRRKPRTAAQKRATAKMLAANRRRRVSTTAPSRRTRSAPSTRLKKRRMRNTVAGYCPNPRRRKYRRNPIARGLKLNNLIAPLTDAGLMAAGAIGIHAAWAHLAPMIPANIKTAMPGMSHALKAATALGIGGLLLPIVTSKQTAHKITAGAVAVVLTGFLWPKISEFIVPGGADDVDGLNEWLSTGNQFDGLGITAVGHDNRPALGWDSAALDSTGVYNPASLEY